MDFGIGIATASDSWKLAQRAEELGFTHAWFFDTQMITADCFVAMARHFEPPDARYLFNHRGHFVFVKPEERRFVTAELIRRTTFTAGEQELKQRVEALRDAGWNQIVIAITLGEE